MQLINLLETEPTKFGIAKCALHMVARAIIHLHDDCPTTRACLHHINVCIRRQRRADCLHHWCWEKRFGPSLVASLTWVPVILAVTEKWLILVVIQRQPTSKTLYRTSRISTGDKLRMS